MQCREKENRSQHFGRFSVTAAHDFVESHSRYSRLGRAMGITRRFWCLGKHWWMEDLWVNFLSCYQGDGVVKGQCHFSPSLTFQWNWNRWISDSELPVVHGAVIWGNHWGQEFQHGFHTRLTNWWFWQLAQLLVMHSATCGGVFG